MEYNYVLGTHNKKVAAKMQSEQFKLSEVLLDKRFELGLNVNEISEIVGLTPQEYVDLEYGEPTIDIENYLNAIKNIEMYEKKSK